jgi:hypothetical protein
MADVQVPPIPLENLMRVVLPIVAVGRDALWHAVGTSFVVAVPDPKSAFLLTAAHNLLFVSDLSARGQRHHPTIVPDFRPQAPKWVDLDGTDVYVCLASPPKAILAEMIRAWFLQAFDVALVLVKIRDDNEQTFTEKLTLDTSPIEEGCPVMAVGYPGMLAKSTADFEKKEFLGQLQLQLQCRFGSVIKKCPTGIGIHKWPGFLVSCPLDSGMSGGPVVDLSGAVPTARGIVGGDVSETPEDGSRGSGIQAFASMLWTAMITPTQVVLEAEDGTPLVPENARLLDLVRHGLVDDLGRSHEHVRFEERDGILNCWWASS